MRTGRRFFQAAVLLALAACGPVGQAAGRTVVVAKDGSGAFTSIHAALASIVDASPENRVTVVIKPGVYEETLTTKDWVDLVGEDRDRCVVSWSRRPDEEVTRAHVIWATSTSVIKNLTLLGKDVKYCIHSDRAGPYTLTVENCVLRRIPPANDYLSALGIGLWAGQNLVVRDSVLEAAEPVYMHNSKGQESSCSLTLEKCTLKGRSTAMLLAAMDSGQRDFVVVHDCALLGDKAITCKDNEARGRAGSPIEVYVSGNTASGESVGAGFRDDAQARLSGAELVARHGTRASLARPGLRLQEKYGGSSGSAARSGIWEPYSIPYVASATMTEDGLVLASEVADKFGMVTGPLSSPAVAALPMMFEFRAKWSFAPKGYAEMQYAWKPGLWQVGWRPGEIYDPANPAAAVKVNTEEWQTYRLVVRSMDEVEFQVVGREREAILLRAQQDQGRGFKLLLHQKGTKATLAEARITGDLP